jgi:hypothetical protein
VPLLNLRYGLEIIVGQGTSLCHASAERFLE